MQIRFLKQIDFHLSQIHAELFTVKQPACDDTLKLFGDEIFSVGWHTTYDGWGIMCYDHKVFARGRKLSC